MKRCQNIPKVSTKEFSYSARTFTNELSSMHDFIISRIYPDAADVGFVLVSAKTGAECTYVLSEEVKDATGDLLYYEFSPIDSIGVGTKVILFND